VKTFCPQPGACPYSGAPDDDCCHERGSRFRHITASCVVLARLSCGEPQDAPCAGTLLGLLCSIGGRRLGPSCECLWRWCVVPRVDVVARRDARRSMTNGRAICAHRQFVDACRASGSIVAARGRESRKIALRTPLSTLLTTTRSERNLLSASRGSHGNSQPNAARHLQTLSGWFASSVSKVRQRLCSCRGV